VAGTEGLGTRRDDGTNRLLPSLVGGAATVIILVGVHFVASIVTIAALSILATVLLRPVQRTLVQRGTGTGLAQAASVGLYVVVIVVFGFLAVVGVTGFVRDLPIREQEMGDVLQGVSDAIGGAGGPPILDATAIADFAQSAAMALVSGLTLVAYSVVVTAYLLLEAPRGERRLEAAFGETTQAVDRGAALAARLRAYVVARAVLGGLAAVLDVALLVVLGVPSALLWGVLAFLFSFVPSIGFILSLIPPAVLALLEGGPGLALAVVIGYSIINVVIDYLVQPRFVGSSVDLAPVVITLSLLFWAIVLGPAGALLAVPLTIVVAALADASSDTRPLARMLGQAPLDPVAPTD
jgi:AI-2 transport protein TqsA